MKAWHYLVAALALGAGWVLWKKRQGKMDASVTPAASSVDIASITAATGEGLNAAQTIDVFNGLFDVQNASDKLDQLRLTIHEENWRINRHSTDYGGWSTVQVGVTSPNLVTVLSPLSGPDYLLKRLGINTGTVWGF